MQENHMVIDFDFDEETLGFCLDNFDDVPESFWEKDYEEETENA